MRRFRSILALALLLVFARQARAAANAAESAHLRVQLVFPSRSLQAGKTAPAGLYFKLEPGWHVYWKNAGDSG